MITYSDFNVVEEIQELYKEIPDVACKGCGACCVAPTCTLSEFMYLFHYLERNSLSEQIIICIDHPAQLHPQYEGNIRCAFLQGSACTIHSARTAGCRLFGIPALRSMDISNMVYCVNNIEVIGKDVELRHIESWIDMLAGMDARLYDFAAEPYYIKGFTIPCWLDIYFDDFLDFDIFIQIKEAINHYLSLSSFKSAYRIKTRIKEKIDKITVLTAMLGSETASTLRPLLLSIQNDYPETGTYFYEEAAAYLDVLHTYEQKEK